MYRQYINVCKSRENNNIYKFTHTIFIMIKKGEEGDISLGTDAWNVADGYTKLKILRQLILLDSYDTVAQFGTENLDENVYLTPIQINKRRFEAIERFLSTLIQLLGNVHFALKKEDFKKIDDYIERLKPLPEFIPLLCDKQSEDRINEEKFDINEELFKKILVILQEVKDQINIPLNKAGLIFRPTEEIDLDKIMEEIISGG